MNAPTESGPDAPPRLREVEARFLWPFLFDADRIVEAERRLAAWRFPASDEGWECREGAPRTYADEASAQVREYLFGTAGPAPCLYRRLASGAASKTLGQVTAETPDGELPLRLSGEGVELFLTSHGVGVVSVTLAMREVGASRDLASTFVYRLAQTRPETAAPLHLPHAAEDAAVWARVPEAQRAKVTPPPPEDAPAARRMTERGGTFRLTELVDTLLAPLRGMRTTTDDAPDGLGSDRPLQANLGAYVVVRLDARADWGVPAVRAELSGLLSGLAQVEEPLHAGAIPGEVPVPNAVLNRRHWAAASALGSAHLIADQAPPPGSPAHPFDAQRLSRVRDKYFVAWLCAWLQRLTLHRSLSEATAAISDGHEHPAAALARVRDRLLRFAVQGQFVDVSHRTAVQRYYEVALVALGVPAAIESARRSITDLDAVEGRRRAEALAARSARTLEATQRIQSDQHAAATASARSLAALVRLQSMVEWIEVFLVSVYAAHLYEMGFPHPEGHGPNWGVLAVAAGAAALALAFLRPWKHHGDARREAHGRPAPSGEEAGGDD